MKKIKKHKITFFFIFILLTSNCLSNLCNDFVIRKSDFNLAIIKSKESEKTEPIEIGYKKIQAFTYKYLEDHEYKVKKTLFDYYIKSREAESKKIHLYGLINWVEQALYSIGWDIRANKTDYNKFLNMIEEDVQKNYGSENNYKELLNEIELARKDLNYGKNNGRVSSDMDLYTQVGATSFGILASSFLTHWFALPYSIGIVSAVFFALTPAIIFAKLWNLSEEKEILKQEANYRKLKNMFQFIYYKIKHLDWFENNLILTGISTIDFCDKFDVIFDYEKDIDEQDKRKRNNIARFMAHKTCVLKRDECPNKGDCVTNILKHLECLNKMKRGKKKNCLIFDESDCSLKEEIQYDL